MTLNKQRYVWIDVLKLLALFLMISNHCCDNVSPIERSSDWYVTWGTLFNSLTRPAVPLFVMITGALLLPTKMEINQFYRKRLTRLVFPFIIWSILYNLFPWFTGVIGADASVINDFFKWAPADQSFGAALHNILLIPINFSTYALQMWYVYLLIGIYLLLPFISTWLERTSKKEIHFFLLFWGISLFIPYLRQYIHKDLWGTCSWNEFSTFYNFAGFSGYLLLGYYLKKYPLKCSLKKLLYITLPMFIVGYGITFWGFKSIVSIPNQPEALVELYFTYCSPNVLLMTLPVYLWAMHIKINKISTQNFFKHISICCFGIWMCHYFFVGPSYMLIQDLPLHTLVKLFLSTTLTLIFATLFTTVVLKWKGIGKWIMG